MSRTSRPRGASAKAALPSAMAALLLVAITPTVARSQQELPEGLTIADAGSTLPIAPSALAYPGDVSSQRQTNRDPEPSVLGFPKRVLLDELHVVTSPTRVRKHDLIWLLPLTAATAASFATDARAMRDTVTHDQGVLDASGTASDVLRDGFIAVPAAMFTFGYFAHADHAREAGILSGEAIVDAFLVSEALKFVTFRERPLVDNGRGQFFQGVTNGDSSFPSGHTMVAWSSAAVLAAEYHKPWQQVGLYTLATGVSLTRITAQQHFPSDVLVGSAAGWLIGHYVYKAHHRHTR